MEEQKKAARTVPPWAKAAIVAELEEDNCDSMTDYFATTTARVVLIGWSRSTRDNFAEMRRACASCTLEEVRHLATPPEVNSNREPRTERNRSWWHPADEHREKYSMGAGYYLKAAGRYSTGWAVRKWTLGRWRAQQLAELLASTDGYAVPEHLAGAADSEPREVDGVTVRPSPMRAGFVEILFPDKPAEEIRAELKAAGFRWSRFSCVWYGPAACLPARYRSGAGDELEAMHRAEAKAEAAAGCRE